MMTFMRTMLLIHTTYGMKTEKTKIISSLIAQEETVKNEHKEEENRRFWIEIVATDDILEASEKILEPKNGKEAIQKELVIEVMFTFYVFQMLIYEAFIWSLGKSI